MCQYFDIMFIQICFLLVSAQLAVASHKESILNILKEDDFSDAVVQLAKLWKSMHKNDGREFKPMNMEKLRERLSFIHSDEDNPYISHTTYTVNVAKSDDITSKTDTFGNGHERVRRDKPADSRRHDVTPRRGRRMPRQTEGSQSGSEEFVDRMINSTTLQQGDIPNISETSDDRDPPLDTEWVPASARVGADRSDSDSETSQHRGSCPYCMDQEDAKRRRLEAIKKQILSKLRLSSPPNISSHTVHRNPALDGLDRLARDNAPGWLSDEPGTRNRVQEDDEFYAKPMRVIHLAENFPASVRRLTNATDNLCYFTFQETVLRSKIDRAKLWVYIRPTSSPRHVRRETVILIHKVGLPAEGSALNITLVKAVNIELRQTGRWHSFDIKSEVIDMVKMSSFGVFKVEAYDHGRPMAVMQPTNTGENDLVPFVDIHLKDKKRRNRQKRHFSRDCDITSREERCCRYPFMVDFGEFGWDFIRQPRRFNAYYCSGACEVNHNQHPNAHGHLVDQVLVNPYASAGPCCVPSKLSAQNVIYQDNNGAYIYGIIPGMTVEKCGCA